MAGLDKSGDRISMAWSNETVPPTLECSDPAIRSVVLRLADRGRKISGTPIVLSTAHEAFQSMLAAFRRYGSVQGVIDVIVYDDDGNELSFVPEPDAD